MNAMPVVPKWDLRQTWEVLSRFCTPTASLAERLPDISRESAGDLATYIAHTDHETMRRGFIAAFGKGQLGVYDPKKAKQEIRHVLTYVDSSFPNKEKRLERVELFLRSWKEALEEVLLRAAARTAFDMFLEHAP
ncbi:MAG: hypothetical protein Q8Q36_02990 [bacterium]|nr:hypothetical protein [bacterium]